jgi:hypothetical protein
MRIRPNCFDDQIPNVAVVVDEEKPLPLAVAEPLWRPTCRRSGLAETASGVFSCLSYDGSRIGLDDLRVANIDCNER